MCPGYGRCMEDSDEPGQGAPPHPIDLASLVEHAVRLSQQLEEVWSSDAAPAAHLSEPDRPRPPGVSLVPSSASRTKLRSTTPSPCPGERGLTTRARRGRRAVLSAADGKVHVWPER